ncbi:aminotransferase class I/II-fold pyridoxal phosphate-dependent enzyme [Microbacterium sp. 1.5R]|uniref:aminotransferase class I/II-fold pyridoxal phosphate-dependent enzyme n=1 Tax=Microbacterium sp. 1.5R TaxID=1916917 RepID=UPI00119D358F|nr:aminotransferase class I/II-fold pyridoxal phosphate-dependent enzyme [Microbacterium sp. 1.5R]
MSVIPGAWRRTAEGAGLLAPDGSVAPTIFAEMSAAAALTGAINLGQGFPDEDGPAEVLEAARTAISRGENQYPPGRGTPDLLAAISEHQRRFYGLEVDPGIEVIVTAGATEALAATLLALIDGPDDEVVVFEPYYDSYAAAVALAGARLRTVPLRAPDFHPDLDQLARAVTDRTRVILINDPHNPTGTIFDRAVLEEVVRLAEQHDAVIVTDEVYEHLSFATPHTPIATLPGAAARTLTISSAGKTFSATGWKIGWVHGPADLITAVLTVKQYLTYVNGSPFQPAVAVGLRLGDDFFTGAARTMARKHEILGDGLRAAGFAVRAPQGGYFTVADATDLGGADAAAFCRALPERAGVVAIPLTAFVSPEHRQDYAGLVRFAACKRVEVLQEAAARLASSF